MAVFGARPDSRNSSLVGVAVDISSHHHLHFAVLRHFPPAVRDARSVDSDKNGLLSDNAYLYQRPRESGTNYASRLPRALVSKRGHRASLATS